MNDDELRAAIIEILDDVATEDDEELPELDDDVPLREQTEMDSLDFLDLVEAIDKRYGVKVQTEDLPHLATIRSTIAYLTERIAAK